MMKDYYATLGVRRYAPYGEIHEALRIMANRYHPDRNPFGEVKMREVTEAWMVLSDQNHRQIYDDMLREGITYSEFFSEVGRIILDAIQGKEQPKEEITPYPGYKTIDIIV